MCRWLLMCRDRVEKDDFVLTHEFLAEMLGVRRQTVTVIAGKLQTASIISYHRGIIRISTGKSWKPPVASATASSRRPTTGSCRSLAAAVRSGTVEAGGVVRP